ncbi:UDP-N-acetylmuramoyl-tripeptide--D-alanyl-D-alanine ligase [Paraliobacillus quinghaiensis]|uniref:UDP-N-acetylmuramoyl-tripeptide--D-alanyl-D-alanine ligase n=1 Tax=Paraliobacillus quinghaiensis TaxID=470815 RepID=A0A917WQE9_9BACI|nr:UDP-N-acetylmuramoyl-tripeptide--D-alanyl-D-alanine ligase [Paraliobacillus quinghaiensis]GGM20578.1 UDP-N-acetylmuramoyl-tripeptide--D-alanyl-D-alanine ligase [Paraliobacillus quinghaiensis]
MLFTTAFLLELFPETQGAAEDQFKINQVSTDSRGKMDHALFVPLKGENFNGHSFIDKAIEQGAIATIWQKDEPLPEFLPTDFPVFFASDTLSALQQLAHAYRKSVDPTVIGVTGSNGKTTTKDIISKVLSESFQTHQTKGNLNNHIGVPLTILSMKPDTEMLVLEMGMNHFHEMERLSQIAEPNIAVITNIGESHIENLGSRAGIAKAKAEILVGLQDEGILLIDGDEPLLHPYKTVAKTLGIGFDQTNDTVIKHFVMHAEHSLFTINSDEEYNIPLLGKHHAKNATFAIEIAKQIGMRISQIKQALIQLDMTGMRFEVLKGKEGVTIINDAYNASPTSMKAAVNVVKEMVGFQRKIVVLGDMLELGELSKEYHRSVADVMSTEIDYVCTIGIDANEISERVKQEYPSIITNHFLDKKEIESFLANYLDTTTLILVKASRGMKLETIIEPLI